mmetsp:Transcript_43711/g.69893  ORF Transcript_43711/g.69893 Transcript_43711/m.69893 type:complete len:313 (-) Transcript_43711:183-1121(-)
MNMDLSIPDTDMSSVIQTFQQDGIAIVKNFAPQELLQQMKQEIIGLCAQWKGEETVEFATDINQTEQQGKNDYFITSACEARFFWEPSSDKIVQANPADTLKKINKVGHGLHEIEGVFKKYAHSPKIKQLVRQLGYVSPVLPQSMYILKNPLIGGEVCSHQDASFLFTEPRQTVLGLWLALDEATLENGCLWYRPGSHKEPVRRHFQRVPSQNGSVKLEFQHFSTPFSSPLEGNTANNDPEYLKKNGFVAAPCSPGDLVLISPCVDHLSLPNTSKLPRHTFQLHLVEGPDQGVVWHELNWLQYPKGRSFPRM